MFRLMLPLLNVYANALLHVILSPTVTGSGSRLSDFGSVKTLMKEYPTERGAKDKIGE